MIDQIFKQLSFKKKLLLELINYSKWLNSIYSSPKVALNGNGFYICWIYLKKSKGGLKLFIFHYCSYTIPLLLVAWLRKLPHLLKLYVCKSITAVGALRGGYHAGGQARWSTPLWLNGSILKPKIPVTLHLEALVPIHLLNFLPNLMALSGPTIPKRTALFLCSFRVGKTINQIKNLFLLPVAVSMDSNLDVALLKYQ